MADIIQLRRDTASNWTSSNPTLAQGELGIETDTNMFKVGDGSTAWTSLDYSSLSATTANVFTAAQRGAVTTDNDLSFDMDASNNFKCTPTANGTLTFTNITAGQSGNIILDNSGAYVISAASTTYISATDLALISSAGVYFISYYSDGTNVYVSASQALTSAGA